MLLPVCKRDQRPKIGNANADAQQKRPTPPPEPVAGPATVPKDQNVSGSVLVRSCPMISYYRPV